VVTSVPDEPAQLSSAGETLLRRQTQIIQIQRFVFSSASFMISDNSLSTLSVRSLITADTSNSPTRWRRKVKLVTTLGYSAGVARPDMELAAVPLRAFDESLFSV
jgi:hypothetical protein